MKKAVYNSKKERTKEGENWRRKPGWKFQGENFRKKIGKGERKRMAYGFF